MTETGQSSCRNGLKVCCVLKSGGDYTPEYVERLKEGVDKHLSWHQFICLSDMDVPDRIPLENNWPGWWSKLEIFKLTGKVLYFDLDTVINGDLSEIADYPHRFTMLQDFIQPYNASGMMAWDGDYSNLYHEFKPGHIEQYKRGGDGEYIRKRINADTFQNLFPELIASHKMHNLKQRTEARVICYHGHPRPAQTGWSI